MKIKALNIELFNCLIKQDRLEILIEQSLDF